jgi:hypothetical protein
MAVRTRQREIEGVHVVLIGAFNPKLFDPWWFAKQKLIQDEEAEKAEVSVITSDVTVFSIGWLRLQAQSERVEISTNQPQYYQSLRDLVIGTFRILRHTPLRTFGLHLNAHYKCADRDEWHKVGDALVPKTLWNDLMVRPGVKSLSIRGTIAELQSGWVDVTVEPSVKVDPGIFFDVNHLYNDETVEHPQTAERVIATLAETWSGALDRAQHIMEYVLGNTLNG